MAIRFDVITLFPGLFEPFRTAGITRRAFEQGSVDVRLWPLRDYAEDTYRRVDDRPYGGGPGMVLLAQPLMRALAGVRASQQAQSAPDTRVLLFSPAGRPVDQAFVREMAQGPGAVLLCGRYEGVDQRFIDAQVDEEVSLGDFVLSGGEIPALALIDAVARLQPGVLNDEQSHEQDSFSDGLLDCPHFSRPEVLDGVSVPPVLLSGHHEQIARWRRERQLELTALRRPDLIVAARAAGRLSAQDERFLAALL
jgi:tRNA (guanine37-N1)-methyltransferase